MGIRKKAEVDPAVHCWVVETLDPILPNHTCCTGYLTEVGALFTTVSSIRVSKVSTCRVSRVSIMVSIRESVK